MNNELYIKRCLELAAAGLGNVAPNPMVGCVIVHNDKIIGEGYHIVYGGPHAEVNAINSVKDKELLKESTLFVNLEPCVHFGKTPPCTDLIIEHKIPRVVISSIDCYSEVQGKGVRKLQKAGVNVTMNILSPENRELNKRFYTFYEKQRPYIILKWAQTINGYIDIKREKAEHKGPAWITNKYSDILVHKWRAEESSIIVGTNTALNDNPQLNVRHFNGNNPIRIVIDKELRLPRELHLFDNKQKTLVFTEEEKADEINIEYIKIDFKKALCSQILDELYRRKIMSIIIEGGKALLESFMQAGLWDEARVFICNRTFDNGSEAPLIHGKLIATEDIFGDKLVYYKNI